jgi:hypothetical protein
MGVIRSGSNKRLPSPQPSPKGRGGRPRCLALYIDLIDRFDYGSSSSTFPDSAKPFHVGVPPEHPPIGPLSLRERARVRAGPYANFRLKALAIMDSAKPFHVGVPLKYPPIGPLYLWERVRVRAKVLMIPTPARRAAVTA